ncbi:HlyD family type I secretion periplasmic adaptor subunit [Parendozoicomonas haliclonae]|uniref:Membrane fusion protein (MFP) family protein n=1 Tax=Parendozoicomonas haliclonae TaxID=1960125 RepID=A0A1X7APK6_9GAMM|nr:HlyD family type I secretion periplasmic adaptor subunit [Parendozoicomonas haliclonae]SMA50038.1 Type I secretion system membrane fusion protein PrsE [Parendozoicomonas haliclonae]
MSEQAKVSSHWHGATEEEINGISKGGRPLILVVLLTLVLFIVWASWAEVDEITRGEGKVVPSSQIQDVQNLEGGIVREILVREGELVEQGQVLMVMDDTRFSTTRDGQQANRFALQAKLSRLTAEVEGAGADTSAVPVMSDEVTKSVPELAKRELELFESRQQELASRLGVIQQQLLQRTQQLEESQAQEQLLQRRLVLLEEEFKLSSELAAEGAVSRVEVLRLERQVSDTRGERQVAQEGIERIQAEQQEMKQRIREAELAFTNKARAEMNEVLAQLDELMAKELAVEDQVDRTRVRAPLKGVVKQILVNTEGGVVQPGMKMMELIPVDDTLDVEVRIRPEDVAFLHPGQKATVRFTAYDFTVYGGMKGELVHLSADTIQDEEGESFYLARIKTDTSYLGDNEGSRPIIAGMVTTVDILTGKKTLMQYLMKPVLRAKQLAFSER